MAFGTLGLLLYAGLCGSLYFAQESLIFQPSATLRGSPADVGLEYEPLSLHAADGTPLAGWRVHAPGQKPRCWVLYCHGNGGNISDRLDRLHVFTDLGVGVVIFDYRGFGQSQGRIRRESDLFDDGEAFYDDLVGHTDQIVLYGESMGGGVAAYLAERHSSGGPCRGLILQSTFTSLGERAADSYPFVPIRLLCRYRLEVRLRLLKLTMPKLIMHSPTDEVIAYRHGQSLFAEAAEPKQWVQLAGGHNDLDPVLYHEGIRKFFESLSVGGA